MNHDEEPRFLQLKTVFWLHRRSLELHGGLDGVRDEGAIESALGSAKNAYFYGVVTLTMSRLPMRFISPNRRRFSTAINEPPLRARSRFSEVAEFLSRETMEDSTTR